MIYMFGWPWANGYKAIEFCKRHPEAAYDILFYCFCSAGGQNFISLTISRFCSLPNTTITSIVVSSLLSGIPPLGSVIMVFSSQGPVQQIAAV
ncbi:hypothetical protein Nepgr_027988 [Nepenthes gracilis]|uniref:Uncharacterized protein n=1 Tax=Nepenthes gracilis TaxID=150966 RepID=A0AAD3Y3H5_NEPGR|nr:hypothetical protein Nepgr_027988 [Nepenthes gracilis]